ncbi:MAG: peptidase M64 N-terminal domain-containing protein, partial [Paludibacter sp.]|nr:peptidase M64 N-terminal domain-containing protein [Paludibacter sp.]
MKPSHLLAALLFVAALGYATTPFDQYFTTESCRVDFHLSGDANYTEASVLKISREPFWGGRQTADGQFMNRGDYRFVVTDSLTGQVLYADGFCA